VQNGPTRSAPDFKNIDDIAKMMAQLIKIMPGACKNLTGVVRVATMRSAAPSIRLLSAAATSSWNPQPSQQAYRSDSGHSHSGPKVPAASLLCGAAAAGMKYAIY
jgi:hypothetical protein